LRSGVLDWCTYNHMLLPSRYDWYQGPDEEYEHLKNHVCIWDVAAERQVELVGPDALVLAELMTPRPLADMTIGQCRYAIITDDEGMVLNDPIVSRLAEDRFWLSGADADLLLWAKGLALGRSLTVKVFEAAVSPLALQGPKSTALVAELFGDWVYDLKYFKFQEVELNGIPIVLARSGWSPEIGYELYLLDESRGNDLWQLIVETGRKYNLKPGSPNQKRRIEGGMLNFGSDISPNHSILELGLPPSWVGGPGKIKAADFVGKEALQRINEQGGPQRSVVGIQFCETEACSALTSFWDIRGASVTPNALGAKVGSLTSLCFSPALDAWIGIATVAAEVATPGTELRVVTPNGPRHAVVRKLPFLPRVPMAPRTKTSPA
jgi:glycine cleavage system aminomethyltransferase T